MKELLKFVGWLALIGLAIYGAVRWWQDRSDRAWENRRRIGFQPNPEPTPAA